MSEEYDPYQMFTLGSQYSGNLPSMTSMGGVPASPFSFTPPTMDAFGTPNTLGGYTAMPSGTSIGAPAGYINPTVGATDSWFDMQGKGGMAIGGANVALGAFNSWMGLKNQKFMQDYYGKQQALQMTDFGNNAKMANLGIENRQATFLSNRGINPDSANGQSQMASHMDKWKVKETL